MLLLSLLLETGLLTLLLLSRAFWTRSLCFEADATYYEKVFYGVRL